MTEKEKKLFCIIGYPVAHSLSPVMQNSAFGKKKINAQYYIFSSKDLKNTLKFLKQMNFSGFNITMPFKQDIIKYAYKKSIEVKKLGATNTALIKNKKLFLYNTDYYAAKKLLGKYKLKNKKALVIGAGGAANAIVLALKELGAKVFVTNRTFPKAKKLAKKFKVKTIKKSEAEKEEFYLIANATPMGMGPLKEKLPCTRKLIEKAHLVYESIYNPVETEFLKEARRNNCRCITGIDMLLEQGYKAFELFTDKKAPEKEMRKAIEKEIKKN